MSLYSKARLDPINIHFWMAIAACFFSLLTFDAANNFNGDNLIECDQRILKEMAIKKIGDRVRIFVAVKQLRNKAVFNRRQQNMVIPHVDTLQSCLF